MAPAAAPPLTGRDAELKSLHDAVDRACAGQGGVVGVSGASGIGKTRLVEAAFAYAKAKRCWDFLLRGFEPSAGLPYWALMEALYAELNAAAAEGAPAGGPPGVAQVLDMLRGAQDAPIGATAGFESRDVAVSARIYTGIVAVLRNLTATNPLVIVVDDLHWLDEPTVNLLRYTVRLAKTLPILLICTYRDGNEGDADGRWRPVLEDAAREGRFTEVRLTGLAPADVRHLVLTMAPAPLSDRAIEEVLRLAEGNPFYAAQLARAVARSSDPDGRAPLPAALRGFIEQRLRGLSPGCRGLIQAIAVVGHECAPDLLAKIGGMPLPALATTLDEALRAQVLTERGAGGRPRYDFTHALLREAVARELNAVARAALHLQVADALHQSRTAGARSTAAEIAAHYLEAGSLAPRERTLAYVRAAADEAEAMGAREQSIRFLTAAIELHEAALSVAPPSRPAVMSVGAEFKDPGWGGVPAVGDAAANERSEPVAALDPAAVAEVVQFRTRLMEAHGFAGNVEAAEREAEAVLAHWRAAGDRRAQAEVLACLAEQLNPRLRPRDVIARTGDGLALLGAERSPLAARLRFLRAHARAMMDDSADLLPTADWLASGEFNPPEPNAEVWRRLLRVLWHIWHVSDASTTVALCREAVEYTRRSGHRRAEAMTRLWEAEVLNRDARPHEALTALDEARRLAVETGSAPMLVDAGALRAEALLQLGRWEELERTVDETLPVLLRLRSTYFGYTLIAAHAWSRRLRGMTWNAPPGLEVRFHDSFLFVAAYRANFARDQVEAAAAGTGALDERTARLLDWLVANVPQRGEGLSWATAGIPLLGALALAGRRDDLSARYEAVRDGGFDRFLQSATFASLELARAATVLRRWDAAEEHFDAAARLATAEGLQVAMARTLVERGVMYRARGRRGDRARAAEVLRRAAEMCDALGLAPDRDRARAMLDSMGAVAASPLPAGITPREAEVLRALAAGRTNRQIADDLTIAEKTVEQHLLNLYQKLQVDSRARAVAWAYAHGLAE